MNEMSFFFFGDDDSDHDKSNSVNNGQLHVCNALIVADFSPINFNVCNCGNRVQLRSNDFGCRRIIPANIQEFIRVFG
ncbi:hypothetical protein DERP_012379 [Dermatophagoides pteronyssinus]|uniref:Uncharacterized protein n=1 Tax=Dermatophagoides pteronyssinus TaxID=6956 RepID=A0ABQ8IUL5_DERPT|nr:hypothetical protein DERP_012379 [Dermatophagoides pteronyssinus]